MNSKFVYSFWKNWLGNFGFYEASQEKEGTTCFLKFWRQKMLISQQILSEICLAVQYLKIRLIDIGRKLGQVGKKLLFSNYEQK